MAAVSVFSELDIRMHCVCVCCVYTQDIEGEDEERMGRFLSQGRLHTASWACLVPKEAGHGFLGPCFLPLEVGNRILELLCYPQNPGMVPWPVAVALGGMDRGKDGGVCVCHYCMYHVQCVHIILCLLFVARLVCSYGVL